ncbi:MAG: endonuclease [Melioribacteraceae bacterium]|nr:endonuclease [Melioribacteraceae bacterium]
MISKINQIFLLLILFTISLFSQTTYYNGTENLSGTQLKSVLHNIINNHKRFPYSSSSTDTWDILKQTDKDTNNSANVILLYSGLSVNAAQEYNGGNGWNREHVWANSHGFPNSSDTAYTDVHHLRPTLESANSARGSKDFDNGGNPYTPIPDTYTDSDSWEPRDAVKGDVARAMMYMTVRYEGPNYDLELVDYTGTPSQPIFGKLSTLLQWHREDPPNDFERNRNDVVQSYQLNRNPFIDRPEFADLIFNSDKFIIVKTEALSYNQVLVTFNRDLDKTTAENINNYSIDKSIGKPIAASKGFGGNSNNVVLTFSKNLIDGEVYNVKVNNIKSTSQTTIIPNSISSLTTEVFVPVELTAFTGIFNEGNIELNWTTATEINNLGFEIERSVVGTSRDLSLQWETIGFVEGEGNSTSPKSYSFVDTKTSEVSQNLAGLDGNLQYRLKQIDFDGNFEYSEIITVEMLRATSLPTEFVLEQNYPNPFNPTTSIGYTVPSNEYVTLKVYDILGNEVATLVNEQKESGNYTANFDGDKLSSGLYIYKIQAGKFSQVRKMMLLK